MSSKRKPASSPTEIETKIRVASFVSLRRRIAAAGGRLVNARTLETNTLFDSSGGTLRNEGRSFRVRRYGTRGSVTLKGVASVVLGMKSREELETAVTSPETLARILVGLGFVPQFKYEKYREVWRFDRTVICFDDTPLGRFVEIEGASSAIHRVAEALGLGRAQFLTTSYPALWLEAGRAGDMVFSQRSKASVS